MSCAPCARQGKRQQCDEQDRIEFPYLSCWLFSSRSVTVSARVCFCTVFGYMHDPRSSALLISNNPISHDSCQHVFRLGEWFACYWPCRVAGFQRSVALTLMLSVRLIVNHIFVKSRSDSVSAKRQEHQVLPSSLCFSSQRLPRKNGAKRHLRQRTLHITILHPSNSAANATHHQIMPANNSPACH